MASMKILALDTATEACSAALLIDGEILQRYQLAPRGHTRLILPMIDELLIEADLNISQLDALAFGRGPGSFVGVRVATSVAQGIAFASGLPVVGVSTLAALAQGSADDYGAKKILSAIDARMDEVYWGTYVLTDDGLVMSQSGECVSAPARLSLPEGDEWVGVGSGWGRYRELLREQMGNRLTSVYPDCFPRAESIARLARHAYLRGEAVEASQALPVYLRDKVADTPQKTSASPDKGMSHIL